jgi:hypothetical protein
MKFPAEDFEPADVIAVLVGKEHAIELPRRDSALLEPDHDLPRAQSAVHENPAMIGRDQRAVARAAAAEHGQSEHARLVADAGAFHKSEIGYARNTYPPRPKRGANAPEAPSAKFQAPKKLQYSNIQISKPRVWSLMFGVSLELGAWNLESI